MERPLPNTYWVIPGRLLAGEYPGDANGTQARLRLASLRGAGIDSYVDLTEEGELPPYRLLLPKHAEYLRSPIADTRIPNTVAQTQELLAAIRTALLRERRVYVHCRAGIGRTGLVVGCFLAEEASDGKAALKNLNRLWRQSERSAAWPTVPQTAAQAEYIRGWPKLSKQALSLASSGRVR
ncbi:MAG: dual specificity protein phosphatase family protein [Steroidobacteraceae bacterium]